MLGSAPSPLVSPKRKQPAKPPGKSSRNCAPASVEVDRSQHPIQEKNHCGILAVLRRKAAAKHRFCTKGPQRATKPAVFCGWRHGGSHLEIAWPQSLPTADARMTKKLVWSPPPLPAPIPSSCALIISAGRSRAKSWFRTPTLPCVKEKYWPSPAPAVRANLRCC